MYLINALEASIRLASPLSKTPKPQIPPCNLGVPSEGNAIGKMSKVTASALAFSCATFQQNAIAKVPLQNRAISSPPTMEGSKLIPFILFNSSRALTFSALFAVYSVCSALVKVPPYRLFTSARVPWSPPCPAQNTAPAFSWP